ncbi:MAG: superoxide dismutase [Oscillospiraceae bacterium]|nr:superoxide dismutase [Oscillospiraceae bacterium]
MQQHYPFTLEPLPYDYGALEPFIDEKTMHIHHDRHLKTYVDNLNAALKDQPEYQSWSLEKLLKSANWLPEELRTPVKNNGGGVYNHEFYFSIMSGARETEPSAELSERLTRDFGGLDGFKSQFKKAALSVFGSGYAWLAVDGDGKLIIKTTANQDTLLTLGLCPIALIDVWEHAYYLKHYNVRADYIDDWFNVLDWNKVSSLFGSCL